MTPNGGIQNCFSEQEGSPGDANQQPDPKGQILVTRFVASI